MTPVMRPLVEALDRAAGDGRTIRLWLRDDDCVAPTPALERLAGLCDAAALPVLLAVIPEAAVAALGDWIADHPGIVPCQHGYSHANHAPDGERSIELGGTRPQADLLDDLARGRARLRRLFGARLSDILVPPWNRIDPVLVPRLPGLGFTALSTIVPPRPGGAIPRLDCDLDIMDWRRGRVGRPLGELAAAAASVIARQASLGLLSHHLAHEEKAWAVLFHLVETLARHPAVRCVDAADLIGRAVAAGS